jgi:hypothetical protein
MKEVFVNQAKKSLQLADHLLTGTYSLVKDPKVLLGVLANIYDAHKNTIVCALSGKVIPLKTEKGQLEQFIHHFNSIITNEELQSVKTVYALMEEHKTSAVEFARKQKLVICDDHYGFQALSFDNLKKHLQHAKSIQKKILV